MRKFGVDSILLLTLTCLLVTVVGAALTMR